MKTATIRVVGKHITENDDELEEGYTEIQVEAYDILREIGSEDVADYARWSLDMRHEDDFESSLEDFSEDDIADYLEEWGYNFSKHIGEEDCIDFLEDSGYTVLTNSEADNGLDIIDSRMLEEIKDIFINASVFERERIYNLITKL